MLPLCYPNIRKLIQMEKADNQLSKHILKSKIDSLRQVRVSLERKIDQVDSLIETLGKLKARIEVEDYKADRIFIRTRKDRWPELLESPEPTSQGLIIIHPDTKIVGLDFINNHWKVRYKGQSGFVSDIFIVSTEETKKFILKTSLQRKRKREELKKRQEVIEANKVWVNALNANVRQEPSTRSEILTTVEMGEVLYVQNRNNQWLEVKFDNPLYLRNQVARIAAGRPYTRYESSQDFENSYYEGWVHESSVSTNKVLKLTPDGRRQYIFIQKNKTISENFKKAILKGQIILGMTEAMVTATWGQPGDINRSVGSYGVHEQWVYGDTTTERYFLYFENGVLTSWQER